jgi:hypothetical protein
MNHLEARLRSWTPRRPSPNIEQRLFAPRPQPFTLPRLVTIFAPTAACLVLTLSGLKQYGQPLLSSSHPQAEMIALSLSNQSFAPYLPGNCQSAANRVATFEWTNGGYSQSSVRSFTPTTATDLQ